MVLFIIILLVVLFFVLRHTKRLKLNNLVLINGGVKSGKTTLAVYLAIKQHKKAIFRWRFRKYVLFKQNEEMPLLYSNIPLKYAYYVPISREVLLHKKRLAYKSICLLSEASLVADAQNFKDIELNECLMGFCKLYAHMSRGGTLLLETQTMSDLHHQFKKNLNNYLYIYNCNKMIPFFLKFSVREMLYNYDNNGISNNFNEDIEKSMLNLWIPKGVWNKFDCYTYSVLTDNFDYDFAVLSKEDIDKLDLKSNDILSFNTFKFLTKKGDNKNE